jgi:putative aminopeptidase FrvX
MRHASYDFLESLIRTPSPSGHEQEVARLYRDYLSEVVDSIGTDVHGNVIAAVNDTAPLKVMLAGHMDEIGFTIHYIGDDGLLFFSAIGGHSALVPVGQMVWVHGRQRVAGAIGRKAIHLLEADEQKKVPELHELWVDIGASSREEAAEIISLGDVATYQYELRPLLGGRATARAFDNKAGLFIVAEAMRLLREEPPDASVGVFAIGTVQEEVGSRGADASSSEVAPQTGIAVDMEHALDYPGLEKSRFGQLDLGKGPSISRGPNTNPVVFDLLVQAAEDDHIPFQIQVASAATPTDAKAMQVSGRGMATGLIGVPLRYMHTPCEVLDLGDVENCARLLASYCRRLREHTNFAPG